MGEVDKFVEDNPDGVEGEQPNTREKWPKKREYILSLLGYSVGLGSLWRFPYLCNRNGGGAFLIPYFTGVILLGLPIFFLEASLGQFSSKSAAHAWGLCPLLSGIGITQFVTSFITSIPYNLVISWAIYYFMRSCGAVLPWTTCDNSWNTPLCVSKVGNISTSNHTNQIDAVRNISNYSFPNTVGYQRLLNSPWRKPNTTLTASEEFWQYNVLGVSSGLQDVGPVQTHLVLCVMGAWMIVFLCLMKGVHSVGKAVYLTALLPYVLLTVLLIRSCMMPGAGEGIRYFLKPDATKLLSVQVWLEAFLQCFYSIGATFGGLISMSSYNRFHNNCISDVILVTVLGEASSIFCGLVVFSTLGFMAHEAQVSVSDVVSSGSGLGFIIYPEAIAQLPISQLWAVLFFLMLVTLGLDSMFGPIESCIAGITELFPKHLQHRRVLVTLAVCVISALFSIPYTTKGGIYIFQLLEWYSISFNTLLVGCLECVAINWVYGSKRFSDDVKMMLGRPTPLVLRLCTTFITPLILLIGLILSLFMFDPPSYGEYIYPTYAKVIGILMAVVLCAPIPGKMFYLVLKQKGSLIERFKSAAKPTTQRPIFKSGNETEMMINGKDGSCVLSRDF